MSGLGEVLTLGVGQARFAVPVTSVQEILDMRPITHLPDAPPHLLGVIDVRGEGVAVMDLGALLKMGPTADDSGTRIVVLRFAIGGKEAVLALKADRVFEVTALEGDTLEPLPEAHLLKWKSRFVAGLGRREGHFVAVLDLERMFDAEMLKNATNLQAA